MQQDEAFLDYVVKALVDHPGDVKTTRVVDQMGVLLTLTVHKEDMGKIIGRDGATAKAIRTLLRVAGMKNDARVNLKINEPEGSTFQADRAAAEAHTHEGHASHETAEVPYVHHNTPQQSNRMKSVDDVLADITS
ncbi:MAG: KH domain-containing protein [Minisyncoccia bacterium]